MPAKVVGRNRVLDADQSAELYCLLMAALGLRNPPIPGEIEPMNGNAMRLKLLLGLMFAVPCWAGEEKGVEPEQEAPVFTMRPIGRVQNLKGKPVQLQIKKEHVEGLDGLEHCSHVMVLWWFDKNDTPERRKTLKVHPCGDQRNPLTGVFATRSPRRPNLIAVTTCKVLSVKGGVDAIDAFDGTPIVDLKCAGTRDFALKGSPPPVPR